ncbi:probable G-protein coupled receptor 139 [Heptranchias perlo]|uniref:probable G-protein coupled receptor 139 n=1 Tax=Heptranchias perlo TaxID=212740 RepID=UPI00355A4EBF
MGQNLRTIDWNVTTMDRNLRTIDWNVTTMGRNLRTIDWNVTTMGRNLRTTDWNVTTMGRNLRTTDWNNPFWIFQYLDGNYDLVSLEDRIHFVLLGIQVIYYPLLAAIGVSVNLLTIVILSRGKCGLSKCVTRYLVAMAAADLLVVIFDLILRQIPIANQVQFDFLDSIPVCNIHAVLLFAATDCSVWFTVTFTFDRFVAICCQNLKTKYCTERTAAVVLGTVSVLGCLKNTFWYFLFTGQYLLYNEPWFCSVPVFVMISRVWAVIELLHYILTPGIPFVLILLLNVFTVRYILVASRARRRLRGHSSGESPRDPEMESRRKSIILLFVISGNFILFWALFMVYSVCNRVWFMGFYSVILPLFIQELGFMLQLMSCCTNTCIYAVTQTKFREQLKNVVKYPFTVIIKLIK